LRRRLFISEEAAFQSAVKLSTETHPDPARHCHENLLKD